LPSLVTDIAPIIMGAEGKGSRQTKKPPCGGNAKSTDGAWNNAADNIINRNC
jgi:hypothetical protein